jgi:hypothetical protein
MPTHTSAYNPGLHQTELSPGHASDTSPLKFNFHQQITETSLSSSTTLTTTFAYSNPITPVFMSASDNEYIIPGNEAKPGCSSNHSASASQWIDGARCTIANGTQNIFIASGTERIVGKRRPVLAMKQCLCPGTPDPPTCLSSTAMHKNDRFHETMVALLAAPSSQGLLSPMTNTRTRASKLSASPDLTQMVRTNPTSIDSGAPPTVAGDLELVCIIPDTDTMMVSLRLDAGSTAGDSNLCNSWIPGS